MLEKEAAPRSLFYHKNNSSALRSVQVFFIFAEASFTFNLLIFLAF